MSNEIALTEHVISKLAVHLNPLQTNIKYPQMVPVQRSLIGIFSLMIIGILFSCNNPRQNYIRGVLSKACFWDVLDEDLSPKHAKYAYRLFPDGTCYKYRYNYLNEEKQKSVSPIDRAKGEVDIKWQLVNDSVLTIGNAGYKVLKVEQNAIWLEDSSAQSFLLQKNCGTYIVD